VRQVQSSSWTLSCVVASPAVVVPLYLLPHGGVPMDSCEDGKGKGALVDPHRDNSGVSVGPCGNGGGNYWLPFGFLGTALVPAILIPRTAAFPWTHVATQNLPRGGASLGGEIKKWAKIGPLKISIFLGLKIDTNFVNLLSTTYGPFQ